MIPVIVGTTDSTQSRWNEFEHVCCHSCRRGSHQIMRKVLEWKRSYDVFEAFSSIEHSMITKRKRMKNLTTRDRCMPPSWFSNVALEWHVQFRLDSHCFSFNCHENVLCLPLVAVWRAQVKERERKDVFVFSSFHWCWLGDGERRLLNLVSIDPRRDRLTSEDKNGFVHESSNRRKHRPVNRSMLWHVCVCPSETQCDRR